MTDDFYDVSKLTLKQKMELIWKECKIQSGSKRARWVRGEEMDTFIWATREPQTKTDQFKDFNK